MEREKLIIDVSTRDRGQRDVIAGFQTCGTAGHAIARRCLGCGSRDLRTSPYRAAEPDPWNESAGRTGCAVMDDDSGNWGLLGLFGLAG